MKIVDVADQATMLGPAQNFTGAVWSRGVATGEPPEALHVASVTFEPGARTFWHHHPRGQILIAVAGVGRFQSENGPVIALAPGDSVTISPGEVHWHGAAPDQLFVHTSIQAADAAGVQAIWLHPVGEHDYHQTPLARSDSGKNKPTELVVLVSGVFHAAYMDVLPAFERETGFKVRSELSPSLGDSPQSVESRLARGEAADVLIMAGTGLDELVAQNRVLQRSRVELARAPAGLAMKEGAIKPDISTPDRLRETLLSASSVGYSISASGQYVSRELFKKLGIEEQMKDKAQEVEGVTPVAETIAKGENQYGFQAVSEILPIEGVELVGKLPDAVEFVTPVSAAVALKSENPKGAWSLLRFLTRPEMRSVLEQHGLDQAPA